MNADVSPRPLGELMIVDFRTSGGKAALWFRPDSDSPFMAETWDQAGHSIYQLHYRELEVTVLVGCDGPPVPLLLMQALNYCGIAISKQLLTN